MPRIRSVARRSVGFLAFAAFLGGCSDLATAPADRLADARARWQRSRPASYEYKLWVSCFCPYEGQPITITVQGDSVMSRTNVNGQPLDPRLTSAYRTIDGMFGVIQGAVDRNADTLDAMYDPVFGYPRSVSIDYEKRAVDDEITYTITEFRAH